MNQMRIVYSSHGGGALGSHERRLILRDGQGQYYRSNFKEYVSHLGAIDLDDLELQAIDIDDILPKYTTDLTLAPPRYTASDCYIKWHSPFTYDPKRDDQYRKNLLLHEVRICEQLRLSPHPNIAEYLGCIVEDGRIQHLLFRQYSSDLTFDMKMYGEVMDKENCMMGIKSAVEHLHKLGLVHNDLRPDNIRMDIQGQPVLDGFDCCAMEGTTPLKMGESAYSPRNTRVSRKENDMYSLLALEKFLFTGIEPDYATMGPQKAML